MAPKSLREKTTSNQDINVEQAHAQNYYEYETMDGFLYNVFFFTDATSLILFNKQMLIDMLTPLYVLFTS